MLRINKNRCRSQFTTVQRVNNVWRNKTVYKNWRTMRHSHANILSPSLRNKHLRLATQIANTHTFDGVNTWMASLLEIHIDASSDTKRRNRHVTLMNDFGGNWPKNKLCPSLPHGKRMVNLHVQKVHITSVNCHRSWGQ